MRLSADVRSQALAFAGQTLADQTPAFWGNDDWTLTVGDDRHLTLCTLSVVSSEASSIGPVLSRA